MVSINLYQSGKIDITLEFPSAWNELMPAEVVFISKTLLNQSEANEPHTRPKLLKFIIENRARLGNKKLPPNWMAIVDKEQAVTEGYPLLQFIFKENNLTNLPQPVKAGVILSLSKGLYPTPFESITCGEFEDCEEQVNMFFVKPVPEPLATLAAILFRPMVRKFPLLWKRACLPVGRVGVRPYMHYNTKTAQYITYNSEAHKKYFLRLKPEELYSIFVWYTGSRSQLSRIFPTVYSGDDNGPSDPFAFTKCIHSGAGPKNGSRNQIRLMKLYEFMYDMELEAIKAEELKQQYEQLKHAR